MIRLAVLQRARHSGFSLDEIRQLFLGFPALTPASARWKKLAGRKMLELQQNINGLKAMQDLLRRLDGCHCSVLEECGRAFMRSDADQSAAHSRDKPGGLRR